MGYDKKNIRIDIAINRYLDKEKDSFMDTQEYPMDCLAAEEEWQEYRENLLSELENKYEIVFE